MEVLQAGWTRWYDDDRVVTHRVAGVFEGGGAKGAVYVGALRAAVDAGCWFSAVAGSSAGAMTAALVAAGLTVDEIEREMPLGLASLARFWAASTRGPRKWLRVVAGLRRVTRSRGFLEESRLRDWLESCLAQNATPDTARMPGSPVTFRDLYRATRIELNVVAANLSAHRQIVFSHRDTPNCGDVDAVLASAAIPFAFTSGQLATPESGGTYVHTIVDGGVWSNFPMFVFTDEGYLRWSERHMDTSPRSYDSVVGFVLEREDQVASSDIRFDLAAFVEPHGAWLGEQEFHYYDATIPSTEQAVTQRAHRFASKETQLIGRLQPLSVALRFFLTIFQFPLYVFSIVFGIPLLVILELSHLPARLRAELSRTSLFEKFIKPGIDPTPYTLSRIRWARDPVAPRFGRLVLVALWELCTFPLQFYPIALVVAAVTGYGAWLVMIRTTWAWNNVFFAIPLITFIVLILVIVIAIATMPLLMPFLRGHMYGLVRTYFAGSAAPPWARLRSNVIALPVPAGLQTLSFAVPQEELDRAVEAAYMVTSAQLPSILGRE